jgi:hypothetical protein
VRPRLLRIGLGLLVVAGVWATSLYSYLLFHTLVELFAIVVAGAVFMLAWNTRPHLDDSFLPWVGASVLAASVIDLVHTLAYAGMQVFVGYDANLPTQLWIAARGLQASCLLVAPSFMGKRVQLRPYVIALGILTSLLIVAPLARVFPDCYIQGQGLTPFKIYAEYVISAMLVAATAHLWTKRRWLAPHTLHLLVAMNLLTVGAELFFTLYVGVYDLPNAIGHLLKVASYAVLYAAIVETGLRHPHELLWRQLTESESALRKSERRYRLLFETMGDGFALCEMPSEDDRCATCRLLEMNPAFRRITGLSQDDVGRPIAEAIPHLEPGWSELLG